MKQEIELRNLVENRTFPKLESYGQSIQFPYTGRQLFNVSSYLPFNNGTYLDSEDRIHIPYTVNNNNSSSSLSPIGATRQPANPDIKPNTQYTVVCEIFDVQGDGVILKMVSDLAESGTQLPQLSSYAINNPTLGINYQVCTSYENLEDKTHFLRHYVFLKALSEGSVVYRISVIEGDISQEIKDGTFKYEPYQRKIAHKSSQLQIFDKWKYHTTGRQLFNPQLWQDFMPNYCLNKNGFLYFAAGLAGNPPINMFVPSMLTSVGAQGKSLPKIPLRKNTAISICIYASTPKIKSFLHRFYVGFLNSNYESILYTSTTSYYYQSLQSNAPHWIHLTPPTDAEYLNLRFGTYDEQIQHGDYHSVQFKVMVLAGNKELEWEPYSSEKPAFVNKHGEVVEAITYDPTPNGYLLGIPTTEECANINKDGINLCSDKIDWANGKYEKHCEILELRNFSGWTLSKDYGDGYIRITNTIPSEFDPETLIPQCLCTHFENKPQTTKGEEFCYIYKDQVFFIVQAVSLANAINKLQGIRESIYLVRGSTQPIITEFNPVKQTSSNMYLKCEAGLDGKYLSCDKIKLN